MAWVSQQTGSLAAVSGSLDSSWPWIDGQAHIKESAAVSLPAASSGVTKRRVTIDVGSCTYPSGSVKYVYAKVNGVYKLVYSANGASTGTFDPAAWTFDAPTSAFSIAQVIGINAAWGAAVSMGAGSYKLEQEYLKAPGTPTSLTVTRNSDNKITASWTSPATTEAPVSSYTLQRKTDGGSWVNVSTSITSTSYADTGVSLDHNYQYQVKAVNPSGSSAYTSASSVIYMSPATPVGFEVVQNSVVSHTIKWTPISGGTATAVVVERKETSASTWTVLKSDCTPSSGSYTDTGTTPGKSYDWQIKATGNSLSSAYSAKITKSTVSPPSITGFTVERALSNGTSAPDTGTYLKITPKWSLAANTSFTSATGKFRTKGGSTWTTQTWSSSESGTAKTVGPITLSDDWEVSFDLVSNGGSTTQNPVLVSKVYRALNISPAGSVGVGQLAATSGHRLDVAVPSYFGDKATFNGGIDLPGALSLNVANGNMKWLTNLLYPVGSIYIGPSSVDPSTIFGGTWGYLGPLQLRPKVGTVVLSTPGGNATGSFTLSLNDFEALPASNSTTNNTPIILWNGDQNARPGVQVTATNVSHSNNTVTVTFHMRNAEGDAPAAGNVRVNYILLLEHLYKEVYERMG